MDKAKAAVSGFLHKDGHKSTTVHETVNPAVQQEHVTPTRHDNVTTAVDREVHQDHFHTSVQPVHDKEVLPEKHTHNVAGVEKREVRHGDSDAVKQRLEAERAQFKSTREVGATQQSQSANVVAGEHVHHHVHEAIQPVIQKETIQPNVVHTTVPVHEVHHNEAKHHTATALPAVSMHDFKSAGGALTGRNERTDAFKGEPGTIGGGGRHTIGGHGARGETHLTERDGGVSGHREGGLTGNSHTGGLTGNNHTGGITGNNHTGGLTGNNHTGGLTGNNHDGLSHNSGNTHTAGGIGKTGVGHGTHDSTHGDHHNNTTTTGKKPGLMDKLNPKKDADGDGKAGFMD